MENWGLQFFADLIQMEPRLLGSFSIGGIEGDIMREQGRFKSLFMISMKTLRDYSSFGTQSVGGDTDDFGHDPSIFFGAEGDDLGEEEEEDDLFEEEEDVPETEDEEEY